MRHLMVILNTDPTMWPAVYSAYDVAARSGADLLGLIVSNDHPSELVQDILHRFETGARAAGVTVKIRNSPSFESVKWDRLTMEMDGVFVSRSGLGDMEHFQQLIERISCPLWIISKQRNIRQMLGVIAQNGPSSPVFELAVQLSKRWGTHLELLGTDEYLPTSFGTLTGDVTYQAVPDLDLNRFLDKTVSDNIDLVVLSWPGEKLPVWEFCQRTDCLLAICKVT